MTEDKLDQPMGDKKKKAVKINVKIDDQTAAGHYSNMAVLKHSEAEFVVDFLFLQPERPVAKVISRIILNPLNAKRLHTILGEHLRRYEARFGPLSIKTPDQGDVEIVN
ncbi:MAG: DUF3467 domain-containing protein [Candidatus Alcyoniella australis]|nr:DUF3467 domain-containing protein [Candidatus Alcyoniella australis]